jgi:hypothetical protein
MAGTAIASSSSGGDSGGGSGSRGGGGRGSVSYGRRRRHGGGGRGTNVYYIGPLFNECMPGSSRRHATAAPTWQSAPSPSSTNNPAGANAPWVVQATDRGLGSGTAARDAFFDRFSTNMVGLCTLYPVESAWVQPLNLKSEKLVSSLCFQIQLAPLQHARRARQRGLCGIAFFPGGAVQAECR